MVDTTANNILFNMRSVKIEVDPSTSSFVYVGFKFITMFVEDGVSHICLLSDLWKTTIAE